MSGESAGGNLVVGLLVAARDAGLPLPSSAVLFSPMTDLTVSGASYAGKAGLDPNITARRSAPGLRTTSMAPASPRLTCG